MPLLSKRRVLAAKAEVTCGTPISLAASDGAMNIFDPEIQPNADFNERSAAGGSLAPIAGVPGPFTGNLKFETDLTGGAAAPSWATILLPACGIAGAALVYTPESRPAELAGSLQKTLTIGVYEDGSIKKLAGCQGGFTIKGQAGKPIRIAWDFQGVWQAPAPGSLLAPSYPTTSPLILQSATFTIGGNALKLHEIEIAVDNAITIIPSASRAGGLLYAQITGRKITVKATIEAGLAEAAYDPHADCAARTERALALSIGSAGNAIAIAAPKLQITNVQEASADGIVTDVIDFQANRSVSAGEDDLSITFS